MSTQIMDNNLNRAGITNYSKRYASSVINTFFKSKQKIGGEDIKHLVDIQQINLFVIKNLFEEWQKETDKLKSPYFDYSSPQVAQALTEFMNTLSRNISIEKKAFEPLLIRAVEESVLLIFSPYDFYTHLTEHSNGEMTIGNLKRTLKYVKVNRNLLESLIANMEKQKLERVDEEKYATLLHEVFQNIQASPDDIGVYFDNFSKIEPLKEGDIYGVTKETEAEPVISKVKPTNENKPEVEPDGPTINDKHTNTAASIAEIHESKKIDNLKSHLSINQRFMFQKVLFDGDEKAFYEALDFLDNCNSKESAMKHIYATYPHWNVESEEFEEFVELLDKRFE
ncbi:MAG TPA: hypothetical protein PKL31_17445 [Fulvivirga sp.]|nr:hypothetical protein [Fulvivirga sp.]